MSKIEQAKWESFLEWVSNHSSRVYYRGESNNNYLLRPKVGRNEYSLENEINMFEHFRRRSNMFVKANNEFEWLALAQHHGLPTRLLDWTSNPLVACFFAINSNSEYTSRIYCIDECDNEYVNQVKDISPFEITEIKILHSPIVTNRIELQKGLFSIHPMPNKPILIGSKVNFGSGKKNVLIEVENNYIFNQFQKSNFSVENYDKEIKKYVDEFYSNDNKPFFEIENEFKSYFNKMIRKLGINETIFGDIDSIAKNIEYLKSNNELSKISKVSENSLIPYIQNFIQSEIINYFRNNDDLLKQICDFKIFNEKVLFKFHRYIEINQYFKTFVGKLTLDPMYNYKSFVDLLFIHTEHSKIANFVEFLKELKIKAELNCYYSIDLDLKIKVLYLENGFTISNISLVDFSREHVEYFTKEFPKKEGEFNFYKNQISIEDFEIIFNGNLSDKKSNELIQKYYNIKVFDSSEE